MKKVLEDSGVLQMLQERDESDRMENIKELLNDMQQYIEWNPEADLNDYLQEIALYTDNDLYEGNDVVQLMTVHAAKGLEFDCVFIYNLCEGIFPSERSISEGGSAALEEERRLIYVAMTRAKKQLFISDSMGYSFVLDKIKTPSRFVMEIPSELMEDVGAKPRNRFSDDIDLYQQGGFGATRQVAGHGKPATEDKKEKRRKRDGRMRKGDLVHHDSFGDGVIIQIEDGLATIAFEQKFGVRKILIDHPSLSRK